MRLFSSILMLLVAANMSAHDFSIEGTAKDFAGKYVYLHKYKDYLTMSYETLAKAEITEDGHFKLEGQIEDITEAFIQITDKTGVLYLDPSTGNYEVEFPELSDEASYNGKNAILTLNGLDKDEINLLILDYEYRLSGFLYGSYEDGSNDSTWNMADLLLYNQGKEKLDQFKKECKLAYKEIDIPYFHDYVQYSIAGLEVFTGGMKDIEFNKAQIYASYINKKPVLNRNSSYMYFVFDFYEKPFRMLGTESFTASKEVINHYESYTKLMRLMSKEYYYKNEEVRELIMMKGILEEYHGRTYTKQGLLTILDSVAFQSKFDGNKSIAQEVKHILTRLEKGFRAPDFNLITTRGDTITLDSLKGKHVYLDFFHTKSIPAISEKLLTVDLYDRYSEYIEFVSICLDENQADFQEYLKSNPNFKWTFASYQGDVNLLDMYDIRSLPTYILIDPEGNIVDPNPKRPSPINPGAEYTTIDQTFHYIKKRLEKKPKFSVGIR